MRAAGKVLLLASLLLWAVPARADYKSSFDAGRVSSERQEWASVQSSMRQALAEQPNPSAGTKINGFAYLPKFYLGLAAFSLNDCTGALEFLLDANTVAAMRGMREAQRQDMMVRTCNRRIAAVKASPGPATTPPKPAVTPPKAVAITPPRPLTAPIATPPRTSSAPVAPAVAATGDDPKRRRLLLDRLVMIDSSLDRSSRILADRTLITAPGALQVRFDALSAEVRKVRARVSTPARDANAISTIERELATILQAAAQLDKELNAAQQTARTAALAANAKAQAEQRALRTQLGSALKPMLDAFFKGSYLQVAEWKIDPAFDRLPEAKAQALILRAAARHAQFVLTGESKAALADQAKADVLEARRLAVTLQPSVRAYSPRFRSFFASAR